MTKPDFSQLAALRIEHESFGRAVTRAESETLQTEGRIPAMEARIEQLKQMVRKTHGKLAAAKNGLKAAEQARGVAANIPGHGDVLELRKAQIEAAQTRATTAPDAFKRAAALEDLARAERQLSNDRAHLAGLDAEIRVAQTGADLWLDALKVGLPNDIKTAEAELQAIHEELKEARARVTRARDTFEVVTERMDELERILCEPALAGAGGAS